MLKNYLSLIKFSHTIFAMPFAIIGFVLGMDALPEDSPLLQPYAWFRLLILVVLCMVFARSAAMAFNRWADRHIDAENSRTRIREIPSGIITEKKALAFAVLSSFLFITTTWFINPVCFYLSPVALLIILGYSYTKRFTPLCHFVLGIGLSLAPIGAYLALTGKFDWLPLTFSGLVILWVSGFDIIYALQDEAFDRSRKLLSIPVLMGKKNALWLARTLHLLALVPLVFAGLQMNGNHFYWIGAGLFGVLLGFQHSLVKPDDLSRVNLAFFTTNGIASVVFCALLLADRLL